METFSSENRSLHFRIKQNQMGDTLRAFIAIKLPQNIIASIDQVQNNLKSYGLKLRWVRPENIHLTLKFLGDISKSEIEKVSQALFDTADKHPLITLMVKGLGVFPSIKRPRVIWVGISGQTDQLVRLQKDIDTKLKNIGFPKEKRPFKGHLTLARAKENINSKKIFDAIKQFGKFESETFVAKNIILFKSELKSTGAVYSTLRSAPLAKVFYTDQTKAAGAGT